MGCEMLRMRKGIWRCQIRTAAPNVSVGVTYGGSGGTKQAQNAEQAAQAATAPVYFVPVVHDGKC